jgi:hypothetical protein
MYCKQPPTRSQLQRTCAGSKLVFVSLCRLPISKDDDSEPQAGLQTVDIYLLLMNQQG